MPHASIFLPKAVHNFLSTRTHTDRYTKTTSSAEEVIRVYRTLYEQLIHNGTPEIVFIRITLKPALCKSRGTVASLPLPKEAGYVLPVSVYQSVCLFIENIIEKVMNGF